MKIGKYFKGRYIKAADLDGSTVVTIKAVKEEDFEEGPKPVVYFQEMEQGLVLNRTNAGRTVQLYGGDTDGWIGKKIIFKRQDLDEFMSRWRIDGAKR